MEIQKAENVNLSVIEIRTGPDKSHLLIYLEIRSIWRIYFREIWKLGLCQAYDHQKFNYEIKHIDILKSIRHILIIH